MASVEREPIMGVWGQSPSGVQVQSPWSGDQGGGLQAESSKLRLWCRKQCFGSYTRSTRRRRIARQPSCTVIISAKWTEWTGEISCDAFFLPSVRPSENTQYLDVYLENGLS